MNFRSQTSGVLFHFVLQQRPTSCWTAKSRPLATLEIKFYWHSDPLTYLHIAVGTLSLWRTDEQLPQKHCGSHNSYHPTLMETFPTPSRSWEHKRKDVLRTGAVLSELTPASFVRHLKCSSTLETLSS